MVIEGRPKKYRARTYIGISAESDLVDKFRKISRKEGKAMSDIMQDMMEKYIHDHDQGNPAFTLDQFNDKEFKVCPAYYGPRKDWVKYIKNCEDKELDEIEMRSNHVKTMIGNERYGRRVGINQVL